MKGVAGVAGVTGFPGCFLRSVRRDPWAEVPTEAADDPITRFPDGAAERKFFGDDPERMHKFLWAKGDAIQMSYELAKISVYSVSAKDATDEHRIDESSGERELLWHELHPKIRNLVIQAYADVSTPSNGDQNVFLKSRRARI